MWVIEISTDDKVSRRTYASEAEARSVFVSISLSEIDKVTREQASIKFYYVDGSADKSKGYASPSCCSEGAKILLRN